MERMEKIKGFDSGLSAGYKMGNLWVIESPHHKRVRTLMFNP